MRRAAWELRPAAGAEAAVQERSSREQAHTRAECSCSARTRTARPHWPARTPEAWTRSHCSHSHAAVAAATATGTETAAVLATVTLTAVTGTVVVVVVVVVADSLWRTDCLSRAGQVQTSSSIAEIDQTSRWIE